MRELSNSGAHCSNHSTAALLAKLFVSSFPSGFHNYAVVLSSIPPSPWAYWQLPPSFITEALLLVNPLLSPSSVSPIPSRPRPPGPSRSTTSPPSSFFIIVLSAFSIVVTSSSGARRARTQTVEGGEVFASAPPRAPRGARFCPFCGPRMRSLAERHSFVRRGERVWTRQPTGRRYHQY